MLYPNAFRGPGACRGGDGYCATHDQRVEACYADELRTVLRAQAARIAELEAERNTEGPSESGRGNEQACSLKAGPASKDASRSPSDLASEAEAQDGTDRLCRVLYGRDAKPRDYLGGSEAQMLYDAAAALQARDARIKELEKDMRSVLDAVLAAGCVWRENEDGAEVLVNERAQAAERERDDLADRLRRVARLAQLTP